MNEKAKIKVAVIGVGHLGQHHARIYSELEEVDLVGVADTNKTQADEISGRLECTAFYDYTKLAGQVDAVSIVVPTKLHFEVASFFLKNKVNVMVEKPITETVEQGRKLLKLAKENNVILQVGHIERFNSAIIALSKKITKPIFIEVERLAPFTIRGADVSVVLDLMIHDIDIILSLVKSKLVSIEGIGCPIFTKTEDIANARLKFKNGCIVNLTASRASVSAVRKIRIFEPAAYYSVDYMKQEIKVYKTKPVDDITKVGNFLDMIQVDITKIEKEEPLLLELKSFIECVTKHYEPIVPGEHGNHALYIAVEIVNKINKYIEGLDVNPLSFK